MSTSYQDDLAKGLVRSAFTTLKPIADHADRNMGLAIYREALRLATDLAKKHGFTPEAKQTLHSTSTGL